jgi:RecA-family ATPase
MRSKIKPRENNIAQCESSGNTRQNSAAVNQEQERLTQALAENLITLLCMSDEYGRIILRMIKPHMFDNEIHRVIMTRASEYWRKYNKAPGKAHTADLVTEIIDDPRNPKASAYRQVLNGMLILNSTSLNVDYVMDQVQTFIRTAEVKHLIMQTLDDLESGQHHALPQIEQRFAKFVRIGENNDDAKPKRLKAERQVTAWELNNKEFPPFKFVVPDLIVEGLTIFAGKPKIGKSWLMLQVSNAVATGSSTLGGIECKEGDVFYCALEDNERRLQARMDKLNIERWSKRLTFRCDLPRLDEGGIEIIRNWLELVEKPRLVIIDTFKRARAQQAKHETQYDADYNSLRELHELAHEYHIAIVVVHHLRKMDADDPYDTVSGTLGLTGAADTVMILRRDSTGTVILQAQGRDVKDIEKAMLFDRTTCHWRIMGDAAQTRLSRERAKVTQAMHEIGEAAKPLEIARLAEMKVANVSKLLTKMARDGLVYKHGYGKYGLEEPSDETE